MNRPKIDNEFLHFKFHKFLSKKLYDAPDAIFIGKKIVYDKSIEKSKHYTNKLLPVGIHPMEGKKEFSVLA
jgi:hypothetical protein